ncbi:hypothetical protein, partial [Stutzerimonas kunmingensis]|uniref:hypothetical protein n=1 Tax=Stutzerimonas kunmingensis TaxID=1211807 RepID=UPI0028B0DB1B
SAPWNTRRQPLQGNCEGDRIMASEQALFVNFYRHCGAEWQDAWSCQCNDECPVCGAEIEPYRSEDFESAKEGA